MNVNISAWSIRNPVPPLTLFLVLIVLGVLAFRALPITRFPNIDVPIVRVHIYQTGSAPAELETQVTKRVEAIEEPRLVTYRWANDDASGVLPDEIDDHATVFTFTLESVPDGTQLTVVETGFDATSDPAANMEAHRRGWDGELDKLVALLEGGA